MRLVEGACGAITQGYPWSDRSSLQVLNSNLPQKQTKSYSIVAIFLKQEFPYPLRVSWLSRIRDVTHSIWLHKLARAFQKKNELQNTF